MRDLPHDVRRGMLLVVSGLLPSPTRFRSCCADERGFTLIELLVVIVVVAILAGILVPDLFGSKGSSQDTRAKAALDTAKTAAMQYYVANNGSFSGLTTEKLGHLVPTLHETKTPASAETAEGEGHDPLGVSVGVSVNGSESVAQLCSIPDKGTAGFCLFEAPQGYKPWSASAETYYSESILPSQPLSEVQKGKGTNSYSGSGWSIEGW